jgi:hypothetical protein
VILRSLALVLSVVALGCGAPCDEGGMIATPGGLVVVEDEHPEAWGDVECSSCHALEALHRVSCSEGIDLEAVRAEVDSDGLESCASCHGSMGASE